MVIHDVELSRRWVTRHDGGLHPGALGQCGFNARRVTNLDNLCSRSCSKLVTLWCVLGNLSWIRVNIY